MTGRLLARSKTLSCAPGVSLLLAAPGWAAPLSFNFSFSEMGNTVTGVVSGLEDGMQGAAASVTITRSPFGSKGNFAPFASLNMFTVSAGMVISASFQGFDDDVNTGAPMVLLSFAGQNGAVVAVGGSPSDVIGFGTLVFTPHDAVAPISLPAGGLLLLTGLAGVVGLSRRKSRAQRG
ncbi:hypothetical protein [Dinoroseobacter sp. S124A]|uniref:hypothetical protein n=1 Tax=Dinoroseobacter sp. S124A TaxID=3415128 RepID=UPI003C7CDC11